MVAFVPDLPELWVFRVSILGLHNKAAISYIYSPAVYFHTFSVDVLVAAWRPLRFAWQPLSYSHPAWVTSFLWWHTPLLTTGTSFSPFVFWSWLIRRDGSHTSLVIDRIASISLGFISKSVQLTVSSETACVRFTWSSILFSFRYECRTGESYLMSNKLFLVSYITLLGGDNLVFRNHATISNITDVWVFF